MENQDIFDQFTENRQTYTMDNSLQHLNNATAGCENTNVVSGEVENVSVGGEILGVKYDEHDVGDDDELKYVKEVQQSEKQQQQQLPLKNYSLGDGEYDSYEFVGKETAKGSHDFGNGNDEGAFVFGGEHLLQHQDMFSIGNGHNGHEIHENEEIATNTDFSSHASVEFEDRNPFDTEIEGFRAEGDFSSTSNNTESVEDFVPQVDVKIESKPEHQESQELGDEEEPSSVATNTTNGTSSLSENVPQPATSSGPASAFDDLMATLENKEIEDPLTPQRPDALNIDHQSILNPDAKEFIPSFGSNPSSPTSPFATGMQSSDLGEPMETQMYFGQQPSALPRHLLGDDDDFVAQSPRKGRGDNNMDSVPLPKELAEFEEEADKRPHELENKDVDVLHNRDGVMTPDQQVQQLPLDDIINDQENHDISSPQDITDFQPSVMDHGPETSVDLDVDIDLQPDAVLAALHQEDDVMKRSMYVASDEAAIEDVLNSVQPIPTEIDSVNNSFIEESATESAAAQLANDKELLQVEEKEHVSHSPSTEEIQMNLQNTLNSSNKDIPQLPIDMDHADDMQEFMHEQQDQSHETQEQHIDTQEMQEQNIDTQEIQEQHIDTHEIQEQHIDTQETQEQHIDTMKSTEVSEESPFMVTDDNFSNNLEPQQQHEEINESYEPLNSLATDSKAIGFDVLTPSSTTDEKHLFEETKEETQEHQLYMEEPKEEQFFAEEPKEEQLLSVEPKQEQFFPEEPKAERVEEHNDAQMFSISGLEQQMSEMLLNNEGHLSELINSQVEEVSAPPAIDDESEHLISPDVAAVADEEDHSQQQKMIVDESFNEFEEKPIREQEQQQQQQLEQQEMHVEPVQEFIESPMHKQDLENEMVAVEEPLFEAKQTAPLFKTEETEIANEPPQEEVVELCMVPETAPCEYLEQPQSPIMDVETQMVETVIEDLKPVELKEEEPKPEEVVTENILAAEEVKEDSSLVAAAAAVAATAALAATAAVVAVESKVAPSTTKKSEVAKKPLVKTAATTATTAKPKVGATTTAAKKPLDSAKKPTGLAAKPRLAPAKPASSLAAADKKPMTKPTTTTTTARKPLGVGSVSASASKPAAKTTTTTSTTRTTARPTTAPRTTTTTTTTRKPITSTTTNGPAAKPRPATAPAKPTSLGLPATNGAAKTKVTSPRPMLSSTQSRKPAPPTLKSPLKTSSTNGVAKPTTTSTLASRTKTTTSSVSTTHGTTGTTGTTKTFTARPAPRSITSSSSTTTTTTTRRLTVGGTTAATTTTTTSTKTSGAPLRKSSPSKPLAGRTPTRPATTAGGLKSKTPITKKESPPEQRPAPIRKPVDKTIIPNGEAAANISKELNGTAEQQTLNGGGDMQQAVQQNGDSIIPNQTDVQQPFLEPRDEQIPMDLINA